MVRHIPETVAVVVLVAVVRTEVPAEMVVLATMAEPAVSQDQTQRPAAQKAMDQALHQAVHQMHFISRELQWVAQEVIQELMDWP